MIKKLKHILLLITFFSSIWSETIISNPNNLYAIELSIYDGSGSLLLNWDMPEDITPTNINIYRKFSPDGDFNLIKSIQEEDNKMNRYLDLNCKSQIRYFYYVEVFDGKDKVYRSDNLRPSFGSIIKSVNQEELIHKDKWSLFKSIIENSFSKYNPKISAELLDALTTLIFDEAINEGSWTENFPIHLIYDVMPVIEAESNYFGREIFKTLQDHEQLYRNQFLLTPKEWNSEISSMYNKAKNNWFMIKDSFQDYVDVIEGLPSVIILGSENKKGGDNLIDLLIIDDSEIDQKSIELFHNNDVIVVDISIFNKSNRVIQQIIPVSWKFCKLIIDDAEVDKINFFENKKIIKTLNQDIIMHEDGFSLKNSKEYSDVWLNEIYWDASSGFLSLEVAGVYSGLESFTISLNGEELWTLDFNTTFEVLYVDSTFSIGFKEFEDLILEYNIVEEGNSRVLEMVMLSQNEDINKHRFPDGGKWVQSKQNTFGSQNIDEKTTMDASLIPEVFVLYQNYPNPFNSNTRISFDLLQDATLSLFVTDATGRVKTIFSDNKFYNSGKYNFDWNAESFSTGVYFFTINAEVEGYLPILFSRKMIYLK